MSRETAADYGVGSPTRLGLECLTHKWTPLIVFALKGGPLRFTELRKAVPGVTGQVLTRSCAPWNATASSSADTPRSPSLC